MKNTMFTLILTSSILIIKELLMNTINSIHIEGKATNIPKVHVTESNNTVASFIISVVRSYKVQEEYKKEISYFMIECWGEVAEKAIENVKYGVTLVIKGRLKQDRWEEKGVQISRVKIMAENIDVK
jgi:single-strand DNA-binding protein